MITAEEKGRVKQYQGCAAMDDAEYRALLLELTGLRSTKDPKFTRTMFRNVMKHIEATIEHRIADEAWRAKGVRWPMIQGRVASPRYWRSQGGDHGTPSTAEKFTEGDVDREIADLREEMSSLGKGMAYTLWLIHHISKREDLSQCTPHQKRCIASELRKRVERLRSDTQGSGRPGGSSLPAEPVTAGNPF